MRVNRFGRKLAQWIAIATVVLGAVSSGTVQAGVVLFAAGVDTSGSTNPQSVPATGNPHIPSISPGVTLSPSTPILLNGLGTGPLNGLTYGPGAFGGSTGGSTGWIHITYTLSAGDVGLPFFAEVANVGDTAFQSALALDNIRVNGGLVAGFEAGIPLSFAIGGFAAVSGAVTNLAPTEGDFFLFLDTTGSAAPKFDTVDGTRAGNLLTSLGLAAGDKLEFDVAFLTTDGTSTYHDYGIVALGIPGIASPIPEPSSVVLLGMGGAALAARRLRRKRSAN